MVKSMTGFGRCEASQGERRMTVEMKSVNHRYLDVNVKMPKKLNFFESSVRSFLKGYIQRGKVDVFITYEDLTEQNLTLHYNGTVAAEYWRYLNQIAQDFGIENEVQAGALSRYPEVLVMEEQQVDEKEMWQLLEQALRGACEQFVETRVAEGENLERDLRAKLDEMTSHVDFIESRSPQILAEYRQKLENKVKELLQDSQMEESRLAAEVILYADKICVDEETVRLRSHMEHTRSTLSETDSVGRKLDFIAQEMNREANTILSKANDLEISNHAIELKTGIEKVREQIQNIE
ncbi:MAG: YicC family protein [Lachnospiraceae bacterium]|nr:YicC family protein [Lachnospiraceae bacterium]